VREKEREREREREEEREKFLRLAVSGLDLRGTYVLAVVRRAK
jgi:hypothetical protein